jgi:hypothetical protein
MWCLSTGQTWGDTPKRIVTAITNSPRSLVRFVNGFYRRPSIVRRVQCDPFGGG